MSLDYLYEVFEKNKEKDAICWQGNTYSYEHLFSLVKMQKTWLQKNHVNQGHVVTLETDYSPVAIATFIALVELETIIVPRTNIPEDKIIESRKIAQANFCIVIENNSEKIIPTGVQTTQDLLLKIKSTKKPGLVIFSSGSTGQSKASVHQLEPLMNKFMTPRHSLRVLTFLLFDHIGGFNTMFYTLFNAGCLVIPNSRTPVDVAKSIETFKAEALTTSPTFLNLFLLNGCHENFNLTSLKYINYSSEVMQEQLLQKLKHLFPQVRFSQAYGLSEVGVLKVKSCSSASTFFKMDESVQTRIVDGMLQIKSNTTMLGYLNAENPFTEDGWFKTGDLVDYEGDYLRILGRNSDIINIGGLKVYPTEIENIIQQMDGVEDASVTSEPHPITGQMIKVNVVLKTHETHYEFKKRMNVYCANKLSRYKIPQKVVISSTKLYNDRFKKMRQFGECHGK